VITYEHPFNERTRTLLRLESLFEKVSHFSRKQEAAEHHVALIFLLEILDVAGRSDLKMDMVQELERQRQALLSFRNNPGISDTALSGALYEIEQASAALLALNGKFGQNLRENDWLMSVKGRAAIPGGLCEFDLPSYHYWLHMPAKTRSAELESWQKSMLPVLSALTIILRLLRSAGLAEKLRAHNGYYQRTLVSNRGFEAQMARITLPGNEYAVPEVSANRLAFNIRFMNPPGLENRIRSCNRDVDFELTFCNL
jgi:cell division protein ZapD